MPHEQRDFTIPLEYQGTPVLRNWIGSISSQPACVVKVHSVEEVQRVVGNPADYPTPLRALGSHHSPSACIAADGGTVLEMTGMDQILEIDVAAKTIRMQAGVLLVDAAKKLAANGLQFYVNIELGNLTVGSGACCATKDASYYSHADQQYEFGQVCSYAIAFTLVTADGSVLTVDETQPELLTAMRSSYGMLGVICEVTFRVKTLASMTVEHVRYELEEFAAGVDELVASHRSSMLYLFPFLDQVVVEHRYDDLGATVRNRWLWKLRNFTWQCVSPAVGRTLRVLVPNKNWRSAAIDAYCRCLIQGMTALFHASHTSPADQIIHYPSVAGYFGYTFSIWAFPQAEYPVVVKAYFAFCKEHFRRTGFRCDMLNVGYVSRQDRSSLFSYSRRGPVLTLDPVCTGGTPGWDSFLREFNEFCSTHNGRPLLNQTPDLANGEVRRCFAVEIEQFQALRQRLDPHDRFYTPYFKKLFA